MPYDLDAAPRLLRDVKRLPPSLKRGLDPEIRWMAESPQKGDRKRGALREVFVEQLSADHDQWLSFYRIREARHVLELLAFGQHENFYRDVTRYLR